MTFTRARLTWVVLVSCALWLLAAGAGRAALAKRVAPTAAKERPAPAFRDAVLIMNPRSGGGKVVRFGLKNKAEALGATVAVLEGPGTVDVGALARQAVADGADLLGVAGGDGTQALVAGIAAEHDIPLLVNATTEAKLANLNDQLAGGAHRVYGKPWPKTIAALLDQRNVYGHANDAA